MRIFSRRDYDGLNLLDQKELKRQRDYLAKQIRNFRNSGSTLILSNKARREATQHALDGAKEQSWIYANHLKQNPSKLGKLLQGAALGGTAIAGAYGLKKIHDTETTKQYTETMEIQKVFSDYYDTERMYSVLMSEDDLRLFSEVQQRNFGWWSRFRGKDTINKLTKEKDALTKSLVETVLERDTAKTLLNAEQSKGFLRKHGKGLILGAGAALGGKYLYDKYSN